MSSARLAGIVVNYRTADLTLAAANSLAEDFNPATDRILIVDNYSADGAVGKLNSCVDAVAGGVPIQVIASARNGGFSAGNNLGFAAVDAEAYLLLNSDAMIESGTVERLWRALDSDPSIGLVAPLLVSENDEQQVSCFNDRTPVNELLRAAQVGALSRLLRLLGVREVAVMPDGKPQFVDWLSFACVMIRGDVIHDVGLMDDGYFMYLEDNDYCRRCRAKGWKVLYLPSAKAVHLNRGWSARRTERQPRYYYKSRTRYFRKFYGWGGWLLANLAWTAGRAISKLRELLGGRAAVIPAAAWRDIWTVRCGTKLIQR